MKWMALCVLAACHGVTAISSTASPPATRPMKLDTAGLDRSVAPGDDFYAFANGGWLKAHEIPGDRAGIGVSEAVFDETQRRIAALIQTAAGAAPGSEARKIGDLYASYMDEAAIEAKGLAPLASVLAPLAAITDERSLAHALGTTLRADVDVLNATNYATPNLFGLWIAQDLDDPGRYSAFLLQGGLEMSSREYYLDPAPRMAAIRASYKAHVATLLRLAHVADPDSTAARIIELETKIAATHASVVETERVHSGDNHWTRAELTQRAPGLDWDGFLASAGLAKLDALVIWHPTAITKISALVHSEPVATWRDYLVYHAIAKRAGALPKAFADENFAFYGTVISGIEKQRERWRRGVDLTSATLGEPVGKMYVAKYFPPSEKARAEVMVKNVLAAFARRIDDLSWMTAATRAKAKAKLAALRVGVGYPDTWRDYARLAIQRDDLFGNLDRADRYEYQFRIARLGTSVDRGEWVMTPQTVDAVNLPAMNALNFPAAIMQPPFFDPEQPSAMDYGAMGSVIGHEISHSFDNTGAEFDATGRMLNWWRPEDLAHFTAASALLVAQYSAYQPFPDLAVNGEQTLGENIADTAGLAVAFDAYRMSLAGSEAPVVDGFTGDQQFFLAFAQSWREKTREQAERDQVLTNGHAPSKYRAATVRNVDAWYSAYHVESDQKLFIAPARRAHLW